MTNARQRDAVGLPSWVGEVGRVVWPVGLLLLFVVAFRAADVGDRIGEHTVESTTTGAVESTVANVETKSAANAAGPLAGCEEPAHPDTVFLEQCLAVQPDDVELMLDLGAAYESAGRWADAERVYLRAVRVDPRDGDAHLRLGRVHLERGDVPAARREGEAALAMQPGNREALTLVTAGTGKAGP